MGVGVGVGWAQDLDANAEFLGGRQLILVGERQEANLVERVRSVRYQLADEDLEQRTNSK